MVKDFKYIIKRILIGVGIALCLMYLKGGLIADAYAMESVTKVPSDMYFYDNYNLGPGYTSLQVASIYNKDYYGGVSKKSSGTYSGVSFLFNFNKPNVYGNTSFVFVTSSNVKGTDFPIRAFMWGPAGESIICNVESSSTNYRTPAGTGVYHTTNYFSTINCPITKIGSNGSVRLFINGDFTVASDSFFGIAAGTLYIDDGVETTLKKIEQQAKETNDTLKDSSTDDPNGDITNMNSKIATNGSITQLLTLPITLYQSILNATTGSCSSFNLGSLFGHNLTLPCINLSNLLGSTLYNIIDILLCGSFILVFRKKMVDIFNHMTSLNDRGNELE